MKRDVEGGGDMKKETVSSWFGWIAAVVLCVTVAIPIRVDGQEAKKGHHHYKLFDLGTFGGPNSYLSYPLPSEVQLNRRGMVVGIADTPNPDPYSPNCIVGECALAHAFQWRKGVLTDLGALPGNNDSYAFASNDLGVIVGISENGVIDPLTGFPEVDGVIWTDGKIIDVGTLGGNGSFTGNVNRWGQVVGAALNNISDSFAGGLAITPFFPVATQMHAFLWQNGKMQDLGTLGGPDSQAQFVNVWGQVAGQSYTNSVVNPSTGIPTEDPFLWQHGRMIDLGTLGGTLGYANWLTEGGQVVGTSNLAGDTTHHAFLWERGKLRDLGTLGGNDSEAWFANNEGEVVGRADISTSSTNHHAFVWKNGVMTDLGTVAGQPLSTAEGINSMGQIVGDSNGNGWLWENGSIVDLNTLVLSGATVHVAGAAAINDRGEIVAAGLPPDGSEHVIVLIPCDEDHVDVEGCDFETVEATATAGTNSAQVVQALAMTMSQSKVSASKMIVQIPSLRANRNRRLGTLPQK
jgi:probable HAF family extracellular repeat protein